MTSFRLLALWLLMMVGGSLWAAESSSTNASATGRGRIVVLGDSITAGYGIDPAEAYPALLQKKLDSAQLPYEVVNAGVSGDTTSGGLRRIDWALSRGADVLIIALGGNDGLRGIQPQQTVANLTGIIARARAKAPGIGIIIAGMQMPENMGAQFVEEFRSAFPKVAKESHTDLVPFLLEGVGGVAELNQADAIHPTPAGQKKIAENVWPVLKRLLDHRRNGTE